MNNVSIKTKIIIPLAILISISMIFLLLLMANFINNVTVNSLSNQLIETVKTNINEINYSDNTLLLSDNFKYHNNGVTTLVYSENKTLIAGQIPIGFDSDVNFENGKINTVINGQNKYLLMDLLVSFNFTNNYWVRGIIELPNSYQTSQNIITVFLISIPIFILIIYLGINFILNKSFKPLHEIIKISNSINGTNDLSQRINLSSSNKEFNELKVTFNNMLERLETSFEREKRFISDVSHELRTPVAVIQSACDYYDKYENNSKEVDETVGIAKRQSAQMANLIEELLKISRLERSDSKANLVLIDVSDLVNRICKDYDVKVNLTKGLNANIDETLFTVLLRNLIENAVKYGMGKEIIVSTYDKDNEVLIEVRDFGIGIEQENMDKIWDRFYQVDKSRTGDSFGLGLSIVKRIAELHNGYMSVQSEKNKGSSFIFHLIKIS